MTPTQSSKYFLTPAGLSGSLGATRMLLRRHVWVWPVIAALILGGVSWWVHRSVEETMREEMAGQLTTILNADVEALRIWSKDQEAIARALARIPGLQKPVKTLLATADSPEPRALGELRTLLNPLLANFRYTNFVVVSPDMQIVASDQDELLKIRLKDYKSSYIQKVFTGMAAVSKPVPSIARLPNARGELKADTPTMWVAAAVPDKDNKDQPLAVLALRMRPEAEFTEILQTARFGETGETYAFAEDGLLLSNSRFDDDLKQIGLLADLPDSRSILTVSVRDPQVNMMEGQRPPVGRKDQPLTKLAQKAVSEGGGLVMEPYRDYRGVLSVGACQWLNQHGFGVATEVDVADAFRPLYVLRRAIWALMALLVLSGGAILAFMIVVARQQRRMAKAERTIKQLGQYSLEEKIGSGGMGTVYRASHAFLRRPTAIKMLNVDNVTTDTLARFEREVQLTSRLNHPNTIAVYDYGRTPDGVFYYAMEYLEGINLEELVTKFGALPEARVAGILEQICGSLAEAHDIGLIHRDIKPANIILTTRAGITDFVKVLDFGLVKVVDADEHAKLTQANVTVGTPYYMSPEAVERPDTITAMSDIYAIGAVGYFLLTGTTVFSGKTVMDVCMKHVRVAPESPSQRLGRAVTPALEAVILRCLAKDPASRPQNARTLMEELARCQPAQDWTRADAEAWWASFRSEPSSPGSAVTAVGEGTVALDSRSITAPE